MFTFIREQLQLYTHTSKCARAGIRLNNYKIRNSKKTRQQRRPYRHYVTGVIIVILAAAADNIHIIGRERGKRRVAACTQLPHESVNTAN